MPHHLAQRHGPLFLRKLGHVRLNRLVEIQAALLQQQAGRRRGERRGSGADPESRFRRDGRLLLEIRPAKSFGPHDLAAGTHRDRQPGQVLIDEMRAGDLPGLLHGAVPLRRRRRMGHRRHVLRVRVQRRGRGADVHPQPGNRQQSQADGPDEHARARFRSGVWTCAVNFIFQSYLCQRIAQVLEEDRRLGHFPLPDDRRPAAAGACRHTTACSAPPRRSATSSDRYPGRDPHRRGSSPSCGRRPRRCGRCRDRDEDARTSRADRR